MNAIEFYRTEISKYTKNSVKKAYLTRSKKECVEHLTDLRAAVWRSGWLHGERVTVERIMDIKNEINAIDSIYKEL